MLSASDNRVGPAREAEYEEHETNLREAKKKLQSPGKVWYYIENEAWQRS